MKSKRQKGEKKSKIVRGCNPSGAFYFCSHLSDVPFFQHLNCSPVKIDDFSNDICARKIFLCHQKKKKKFPIALQIRMSHSHVDTVDSLFLPHFIPFTRTFAVALQFHFTINAVCIDRFRASGKWDFRLVSFIIYSVFISRLSKSEKKSSLV